MAAAAQGCQTRSQATAIEAFAREPGGGLVVPPSALAAVYQDRIIALAAQSRLPAVYPYSEFAAAGGLMSYGLDRTIVYQQAASYVDRILKGENASDLPVQTPTKFELVVNLKTAKALGLTISESFLLLANKVIE
jgi:putative ABC transport system substrate-binding protein